MEIMIFGICLLIFFLLGGVLLALPLIRKLIHKIKHNMENNTQNQNGAKLWLKLTIIFALSLLLLIPQAIIQNMVDERRGTEMEANMEVCEKWGGTRTVRGPVLFIPGDTSTHNVYLLPEVLDISSEVETKTLKRGIYDFSVYEAPVKLTGTFALPKELSAEQVSYLKTGRAKLLFSINDFKGFMDYPTLTYGGQQVELQAEGLKLGNDDALSCAQQPCMSTPTARHPVSGDAICPPTVR